ncbi:hypothetical protein ACFV1W_17515 [Kitasatospora sp. NPDC059648]|uniref:hypothetical protein n=1 Tax=Kitasatospora sp. NPDC059648 TaxID=3346894 RepID=UPI0036BE1A4F
MNASRPDPTTRLTRGIVPLVAVGIPGSFAGSVPLTVEPPRRRPHGLLGHSLSAAAPKCGDQPLPPDGRVLGWQDPDRPFFPQLDRPYCTTAAPAAASSVLDRPQAVRRSA